MAAGKITRATAEATLEGLSRVGEGWHVSTATAIAEGKHKVLGMDRREFVSAAGGFKLTDTRQAILDLHERKLSKQAIADVLGISADRVVSRVLYEEGRIATLPKMAEPGYDKRREQAALGAGDPPTENAPGEADLELEDARREADDLRLELRALKARTRDAVEEAKADAKAMSDRAHEALIEAHRLKEEAKTDAQRAREASESNAFAEKATEHIRRMTAGMAANNVVSLLDEATETISDVIEGEPTDEMVTRISASADRFQTELEVARGMVGLEAGS